MTGFASAAGRGPLVALSLPRHRHQLLYWHWSTPGRIRSHAAAVVTLACCLAALTAVLAGQLHEEFGAIGQTDAPEADATTGLYFALNDMDAQVANVLMVGGEPALAVTKAKNLAIYATDRSTASRDLERATAAEADNAAAQRELSLVLDRIGQYEALAADAQLAAQQAHGAGGRAPASAVRYFQQATDLMQTGILPSVESLANVSAARLDTAYQGGRRAAVSGIVLAVVVGLLLAGTLVTLQLYLAARFRRLLNPALATATVLVLVFVAVTVDRLGAESGQLKVARQDSFGSIQALGLARAVSYNANADESRYLADPGRAGRYQQAFLSKSQQIANVGPVTISGYDAALAADIKAYQRDNADVRFGGYLGAEFRNITFPGERQAAVATLLAFQRYERDDRTMRALANHSLTAAVAYDTGTALSQSDGAFNQYDAALSSVIAVNSAAFTTAVTEGENGTASWYLALAALAGLLVAALTYAGVRRRLGEYR
ncbi:MAG TPA: hypothetical protein VN714_05140 [Trebonia sp.]|nr:hypothetical protein [Trebonia sp.]